MESRSGHPEAQGTDTSAHRRLGSTECQASPNLAAVVQGILSNVQKIKKCVDTTCGPTCGATKINKKGAKLGTKVWCYKGKQATWEKLARDREGRGGHGTDDWDLN